MIKKYLQSVFGGSIPPWRERRTIHVILFAICVPLISMFAYYAYAIMLSGVGTTNITETSVQVTWTTDVAGDSRVNYGPIDGTYTFSTGTRCDAGGNVTSHCVQLSALTPSTKYYYQVSSTDSSGVTTTAAGYSFTTSAGINVLSNISVTEISSDSVRIAWISTQSSDSSVAYGTASGSYSSVSSNVCSGSAGNVTAHCVLLSGLSGDVTYYFEVRSGTSTGGPAVLTGTPFTTLSVQSIPLAPSGTSASPNTDKTVQVSWADTSSDETRFEVYMKQSSASVYTKSGEATVNATSYTTPVLSDGTYSFQVRACNATGCSDYSTAATATVETATVADTTAPSVPISLSLSVQSQTSIALTWNPSTDNTGVSYYKINRGGSDIAQSTSVNYTDSGLSAGTSYTYKVAACDTAGNCSAYSSASSATTTAAPVVVPDSPTVSSGWSVGQILEAEKFSTKTGNLIVLESTSVGASGNAYIGWTQNDDVLVFNNVDLTGAKTVTIRAATKVTGSTIEFRYGSKTGTLLGKISVSSSLGWASSGSSAWKEYSVSLAAVSGIKNVYMVFKGGTGEVSDLDWIKFSTTEMIIDSPTITNVTASGISKTEAIISFLTSDEPADTQVEYGVTTAYGKTTTLSTTLTNPHSQTLTNLTANTTYHYRVKSRNATGALSVSSDKTFTTLSEVATATLPVGKKIEAEKFSTKTGSLIVLESTSVGASGNAYIGWTQNDDVLVFNNVDLTGAKTVTIRAATKVTGSTIEFRYGSKTGTLLGKIIASSSLGWVSSVGSSAWQEYTSSITPVSGVKTLYVVYKGATTGVYDLDWLTFNAATAISSETITPTTSTIPTTPTAPTVSTIPTTPTVSTVPTTPTAPITTETQTTADSTMDATQSNTGAEIITPDSVKFSLAFGQKYCSGGKTYAPVTFTIVPFIGGYFSVPGIVNGTDRVYANKTIEVQNGTYNWMGVPNSGYTAMSSTQGTFTISRIDCSVSSVVGETSSTPTKTITPTETGDRTSPKTDASLLIAEPQETFPTYDDTAASLQEKVTSKVVKDMTVQEKIQVVQDARETIAPAPQSDTVQVGSTVMSRREGPAAVIAAVKTVVEERATTTIALFDEDKDGIIDYDEIHIYGTDPKKGDTNEDGISDGASILAGINPSEKNFTGVTYEDAKKVTVAAVGSSQIFEVKKITPKLTVATEDKPEKIESVTFSGRALAHSFVTLYFYSTPIVVTVKTDDTGNWEYTIDRELEDGEHNVYVAMTDSGGKILVKTSPIPFIKTANAITLGSLSAGAAQGGFFQGNMLLIFAGFIVAVIAVAFLVISIILKKDDSTTN